MLNLVHVGNSLSLVPVICESVLEGVQIFLNKFCVDFINKFYLLKRGVFPPSGGSRSLF